MKRLIFEVLTFLIFTFIFLLAFPKNNNVQGYGYIPPTCSGSVWADNNCDNSCNRDQQCVEVGTGSQTPFQCCTLAKWGCESSLDCSGTCRLCDTSTAECYDNNSLCPTCSNGSPGVCTSGNCNTCCVQTQDSYAGSLCASCNYSANYYYNCDGSTYASGGQTDNSCGSLCGITVTSGPTLTPPPSCTFNRQYTQCGGNCNGTPYPSSHTLDVIEYFCPASNSYSYACTDAGAVCGECGNTCITNTPTPPGGCTPGSCESTSPSCNRCDTNGFLQPDYTCSSYALCTGSSTTPTPTPGGCQYNCHDTTPPTTTVSFVNNGYQDDGSLQFKFTATDTGAGGTNELFGVRYTYWYIEWNNGQRTPASSQFHKYCWPAGKNYNPYDANWQTGWQTGCSYHAEPTYNACINGLTVSRSTLLPSTWTASDGISYPVTNDGFNVLLDITNGAGVGYWNCKNWNEGSSFYGDNWVCEDPSNPYSTNPAANVQCQSNAPKQTCIWPYIDGPYAMCTAHPNTRMAIPDTGGFANPGDGGNYEVYQWKRTDTNSGISGTPIIKIPANKVLDSSGGTIWFYSEDGPSQSVSGANKETLKSINFRNTLYSISGNVYMDYDHNGFKDNPGDSNYPNATVTVSGQPPVSTNTFGNYSATNLSQGTYTVTLTVPAGYQASTTNPVTVNLSGNTTVNFGITPIYSVSGNLFIDNNKNTFKDGGENNYVASSSFNLTNRDTGQVIPVTTQTGTYTSGQTIISGNYTASYETKPTTYDMTYPKNGPPPFFLVVIGKAGTRYSCSVGNSNSALCDANGNIYNLNFGISNSIPWWQCKGGDCSDSGGIVDPVPVTAACGTGAYISVNSSTSDTPGMIFSWDKDPNPGFGQISTTGWVVGNFTYPEFFQPANNGVIRTSYGYMMATARQSGITPTALDASCNSPSGCSLGALANGLYSSTGPTYINATTFPVGKNYVITVNGDLHILGNITVPNGSTATFSVSGSIIVDKSVINIEGFYSTDGIFSTGGNNGDCTQSPDSALTIQGAVVVNAALAGGTFTNQRDLCGGNLTCPANTFIERPDFILNAPEFIKHPNYTWQEAAP